MSCFITHKEGTMNRKLFIALAALIAALGLIPLARGDPGGNPYLQKVSLQPTPTISIFQSLWDERPRVVTYDTYGRPTKIVRVACPLEMLTHEHFLVPDAIRQGANAVLSGINDKDILPWDVWVVCSAGGET